MTVCLGLFAVRSFSLHFYLLKQIACRQTASRDVLGHFVPRRTCENPHCKNNKCKCYNYSNLLENCSKYCTIDYALVCRTLIRKQKVGFDISRTDFKPLKILVGLRLYNPTAIRYWKRCKHNEPCNVFARSRAGTLEHCYGWTMQTSDRCALWRKS